MPAAREKPFVPRQGAWSARWIWLNADAYPDRQKCRRTLFREDEFPYALALFRRVFDVPFVPLRVTAWLSGDTKYRCRVNGRLVSLGPAEAGGDYANTESPDWWFYEGHRVDSALRRGLNAITAEVVLGPVVQADYSMGRGGFLLEILVEGPAGESLVLETDDSWRGIPSAAARAPETWDARFEPRGWDSVRFDDSRWPRARVIGPATGSGWKLLPREIPQLSRSRISPVGPGFPARDIEKRFAGGNTGAGQRRPLIVKSGPPAVFRLTFPREIAGFLRLDLEGPAGTRVEINFREMPELPGRTEAYILPGRRWRHESLVLRAFEYLDVTVTFPGDSLDGRPLKIHSLEAILTSFPVRNRGSFESSDTFLDRAWEVGRWTTRLCMQSYHLDSPVHQEGLGCTGDYMIEALVSYRCFGESRLARKDILRTAYLLEQKKGRMFHTSYSLLWVWMVRDYWMFSGDAATVREVLPRVHELLALFDSYLGDCGIITEAPDYMFMDWSKLDGLTLHHPPACIGQGYMSALYCRTLDYGAELSALCGRPDRAAEYSRRAKNLRRAFHDLLWDPARGLYADGLPGLTKVAPHRWLPPDRKEKSFTAHANALAVLAGIPGIEAGRRIMHRVMRDKSLPVVQPYFMHFVFEALAATGLFERYAFDEMRRWEALLEEHPGSWKEGWDFGDYSHAWSGTPTYQLSTRVLGVSPRTAGFREVSLAPCLGPLSRASGSVPTPRGKITVSWKKSARGDISGFLSGPPGTRFVLGMDRLEPGRARAYRGAEEILLCPSEDGFPSLEIGPGRYRLEIPAPGSG